MSDTPEGRVKKSIRDYLKTVPGLWYTPIVQNGYGKTGVPDYLVCYRGRFIALEVKAEGKTATPAQRREISDIINAGGYAEIVWNVEQVRELMPRIARIASIYS